MEYEGNQEQQKHRGETEAAPAPKGAEKSGGATYTSDILRPLRTFKDDVARALGKQRTGVVGIAAAEEKRRTKRRTISERERKLQEEIEREGAKIRTLSAQIEQTKLTVGQKEEPVQKRYTPPPNIPLKMVRPEAIPKEGGIISAPTVHSKQLAELRAAEKHLAEAEAKLESTKKEGQRTSPVQLRPKPATPSTSPRTFILIGVSVVLIALGSGIGVYVYRNFSTIGTVSPAPTVPTLVPVGGQVEVFHTPGSLLAETLSTAVSGIGLDSDSFVQLYTTRNIGDARALLSAQEFVELLAPLAPGRFSRSLKETYTFGVHSKDKRQMFLVFRTTFFENAFAGMLEWEPSIQNDLSLLFGSLSGTSDVAAQSGTSTPPASAPQFTDRIIQNKDARVLLDQNDNVSIIYSFVDRDTLIIATSIETFIEVFGRMTSGRVVR